MSKESSGRLGIFLGATALVLTVFFVSGNAGRFRLIEDEEGKWIHVVHETGAEYYFKQSAIVCYQRPSREAAFKSLDRRLGIMLTNGQTLRVGGKITEIMAMPTVTLEQVLKEMEAKEKK